MKRRSLALVFVLLGSALLSGCYTDDFTPDVDSITLCSVLPFICKNDDYQPEQPIFYSHKIHAGDNQIPCQYCHSGARRSEHAVIPSVDRCMGCHKFVGITTEENKKYQPELDKLKKYWADGESIPWVKVHDLPDHVRFDHQPHVQGGLECQSCHGNVEEFTTGKKLGWDPELKQAPLSMGWCVQCHTENAPRVAEERLLAQGLAKDAANWDERLTVEKKTVLKTLKNCYTCHK